MQPESDTHPVISISADGKCLDNVGNDLRSSQGADVEVLEICICAQQFQGGDAPASLLGKETSFLPSSLHFQLTHFEPLDSGDCILRYQRKE